MIISEKPPSDARPRFVDRPGKPVVGGCSPRPGRRTRRLRI